MYANSTSYDSGHCSAYGQPAAYHANPVQAAYQKPEQACILSENVSKHASIAKEERRESVYSPKSVSGTYLMPRTHLEPEAFLNPDRPLTRFVGSAQEIQEHVEQAFRATTGKKLPDNTIIAVLGDKEFDEVHAANNGIPSKTVQGFSLNRNGKGVNEVFVRANNLDKLLLTVGHEIGHVLTPALPDEVDEEAKAFAFSLAWMNAIREKNIAGIGAFIMPEPAQNGVHDAGLGFVQELLRQGKNALQAFKDLAKGIVSTTKKLEVITLEE